MVPCIDGGLPFPDPRTADDEGLVAYGGEMTVQRLVDAYRSGIFPWSANPVTWWSPDPRGILDLDQIHVPKRLRARMRDLPYRVTFDQAFNGVIDECSTVPRKGDECWITREFLDAYKALHRAGFAHSIELWRGERLVAGVYGVAMGGLFAGESMFHRETDASKIALILLQQHLRTWGFTLFDTQMLTPVTEALGAYEIAREEYLRSLEQALRVKIEGAWR